MHNDREDSGIESEGEPGSGEIISSDCGRYHTIEMRMFGSCATLMLSMYRSPSLSELLHHHLELKMFLRSDCLNPKLLHRRYFGDERREVANWR